MLRDEESDVCLLPDAWIFSYLSESEREQTLVTEYWVCALCNRWSYCIYMLKCLMLDFTKLLTNVRLQSQCQEFKRSRMQAELKIKMEEWCLRLTGLSCKGKYLLFHFPGMTWKTVQYAPEDASPICTRRPHFLEAYFSIHLQVWSSRRGNTFN